MSCGKARHAGKGTREGVRRLDVCIRVVMKFLKDILTKKRRMTEYKTVALTSATNAVFKNGVPEKITNPKSFTVPCSIDDVDLGCTLCDLGASINLMSLSIFKKLGLGKA
ncbi:uncharacterized protein E5676_scaffold352G007380 [Cucumis melo var. makuwa]|uniref:Gag-asp_proteas domain-containing protein n=1 Tax=Cucumis melo var. makuwa TaxID=1194695 RepID=A0A5A7UF03_CUCMM|nr:uncharacterized protein E6C27_scaffold135G002080 [Cucumis melo var. makuwa]TYK25581.1 uncharacterized protein E5676_scaffold352G007380 [Cucumis melo var. makuwa]